MFNKLQQQKSSKFALGLILAVVFVVFALVLFSPSYAPAEPVITWTPASVTEIIVAGESKTVSVFFTASEDITNAVIRVVPELEPFVQVSPSAFGSIAKNQIVNLNITFSALSNSPLGTFQGTVQLRSGSDSNKTFAKPLPVTVQIWKRVILGDDFTGVSVATPSQWIERRDENGVVILSNIVTPSPLTDVALQTESSFELRLLTRANPDSLSISEWFDQFFEEGFSVDPLSRQTVAVCGRDGVEIETLEIGRRIHIYIPRGFDVIEISYGLFASAFVDEYRTMVAMIGCSQ